MTLDQFLAKNGMTRAAFASRVGVSRVTLQRYLAGERFPRPAVLRRISAETKGAVTANDFVSEPETVSRAEGDNAAAIPVTTRSPVAPSAPPPRPEAA